MRITVSLNQDETRKAAAAGTAPDLAALIMAYANVPILRVFGRGRYANIEVDPKDLELLQERLGDRCVFAPVLEAEVF